jgi:thioredoxin-like negative regulator of GroEL
MSKLVDNATDLDKILKEKENLFVLVYASWCPYSARFLPIFEKHANDRSRSCARVVINDDEVVADKYDVHTYPAVLFFNTGQVVKRLDSVHGEGLDENQLKDFFANCRQD